MEFDYPKDPEVARQRIIEWLNRIVATDESFARKLVNTRLEASDAIVYAKGDDEVQLVVGKDGDMGWNASFLGVLNGALQVLGCSKIQMTCHMTQTPEGENVYPIKRVERFGAHDGRAFPISGKSDVAPVPASRDDGQ